MNTETAQQLLKLEDWLNEGFQRGLINDNQVQFWFEDALATAEVDRNEFIEWATENA